MKKTLFDTFEGDSDMYERRMFPVLKWAGGKSQLLDSIVANFPREYNRYFEPFIGGAAVFLSISPQNAHINDINEQLINLYQQIRNDVSNVIEAIRKLDSVICDKEYYYSIREKYNAKIQFNELDAECAALMIWINKHCFNGLYRVNGKGFFNVPYNNKVNGRSVDEDNLLSISKYLQTSCVKITCQDFEIACRDVSSGDLVYFDSPYVPVSKTSDFTDYTKDGFELADHQRLARLFQELHARGAYLLLTNNDVPLVHELYSDFNIQSLEVKRMINRDASKRVGREVIVTNY